MLSADFKHRILVRQSPSFHTACVFVARAGTKTPSDVGQWGDRLIIAAP